MKYRKEIDGLRSPGNIIFVKMSASMCLVGTQHNRTALASIKSRATKRSIIVWRSFGILPVVFKWSYKDFASVTKNPGMVSLCRQSGV